MVGLIRNAFADMVDDMSMKISRLIAELIEARENYGDLPVYTSDADIARVEIYPCKDGVSSSTNGIPDEANEFYLEFIPS